MWVLLYLLVFTKALPISDPSLNNLSWFSLDFLFLKNNLTPSHTAACLSLLVSVLAFRESLSPSPFPFPTLANTDLITPGAVCANGFFMLCFLINPQPTNCPFFCSSSLSGVSRIHLVQRLLLRVFYKRCSPCFISPSTPNSQQLRGGDWTTPSEFLVSSKLSPN